MLAATASAAFLGPNAPRHRPAERNDNEQNRGSFVPAEASETTIAFPPSYFLQSLGYPHASAPPVQAERIAWRKWLKGMALVYGCGGAFVVLLASGSTMRPLEATAQMERLAARVDHTRIIPRETAYEIAHVIGQPWYDCNQVACNAQLETRNRAVRDRLKLQLSAKQGIVEVDASKAKDLETDW